MKVNFSYTLPNDIGISVMEVDDKIVKKNFNNRFQVVLEYEYKKIFPKEKKKYLKFKEKRIVEQLKSDINKKKTIELNQIQYFEKILCDKTLEQCNDEVLNYLQLYNEDKNLFFRSLRENFEF